MQSGKRTLSLYYNYLNVMTKGWAPCSRVIDGLWIGMLPTKDAPIEAVRNLDDKIIEMINLAHPDRPLKLVISVVEKDELTGKGFVGIKTVMPDDWQQKQIEHFLLIMKDFTADVSSLDTIKAILKLKKHIDDHGTVYVHCKAGRARSAMLCAIYLASFEINQQTMKRYTLDEAADLLETQREQVNLSSRKRQTAQNMIDLIEQCQLRELLAGTQTWAGICDKIPDGIRAELHTFMIEDGLLKKDSVSCKPH